MAGTIVLHTVVLEFMAGTVLLQGWHRFPRIYTNLWLAPVHTMADTIVLCPVVLEFMDGTSEQIAEKLR